MNGSKKSAQKTANYSSRKVRRPAFSSPLALGLLSAVPGAKDPVDAILWHAGALVIESGMTEPPYSPASYAPLRNVKEIIHRDMEVDGRLIPYAGGFIIELRKDRSHERKNFTLAHELAHTFFYESVPSIKYRALASTQPHHDPDEEMLCNIAAAEMLMPSAVFSKIARDYSVSPQSLQELAQLFGTSLIATIVHLLRLRIWNSMFILWEREGERIKAKWLAKSGNGLVYSPALEIADSHSSSINRTFITGETTTNTEWLRLNDGYKLCPIQSKRLNSKMVLSSISLQSAVGSPNLSQARSDSPALPMRYDCECDGTGWRMLKKDGRTYAARCRASHHKTH
jgi:Zn-dependent peptidase ImmA (M78 family)